MHSPLVCLNCCPSTLHRNRPSEPHNTAFLRTFFKPAPSVWYFIIKIKLFTIDRDNSCAYILKRERFQTLNRNCSLAAKPSMSNLSSKHARKNHRPIVFSSIRIDRPFSAQSCFAHIAEYTLPSIDRSQGHCEPFALLHRSTTLSWYDVQD